MVVHGQLTLVGLVGPGSGGDSAVAGGAELAGVAAGAVDFLDQREHMDNM